MLGALAVLAIAYRYYSAFIAAKVLCLDASRVTPAHEKNDGHNFHPTNKWVLFGHHFAAITGAGPLIGPVLAAQFGFLPGFIWILFGVVLGGAVHDFVILVASTRRGGRSKPQFTSAAQTRSRLSRTAVAASPTMYQPGNPLAESTSTVTGMASMPTSAAEWAAASMPEDSADGHRGRQRKAAGRRGVPAPELASSRRGPRPLRASGDGTGGSSARLARPARGRSTSSDESRIP